jgi:hypothetical protein
MEIRQKLSLISPVDFQLAQQQHFLLLPLLFEQLLGT